MEGLTSLAEYLTKYGMWGLVPILLLVIVYQERKITALQKAAPDDRERLVKVIEANNGLLRELTEAQKATREMLEERRYGIAEMSLQIHTLSNKVMHGFGNTSAGIAAIARFLERLSPRSVIAPILIPDNAPSDDAEAS